MMRKQLIWVCTVFITLALTLTACGLPEMTPPSTTNPSPIVTDTQIVVIPAITITVEPTEPLVTVPIKANNAGSLKITQQAAVRNVQGIAWSPDSLTLALTTQNNDLNNDQVYGVTLLKASDLSTFSVYSSTGNRVTSVAADGKTAAVISKEMTAFSLVDTSDNAGLPRARVTDFLIGDVSFSPDLRFVAVTKAESWEVVLYDFNTLNEVRILTGFETAAPVFDAKFDNSPQWMVWHARGTLQLQEIELGVLSYPLMHEDFVYSYSLSPDGTLLASASASTIDNNLVPVIKLWDTSSSTELRTLVLSEPVNTMKFSPDGKFLAVAVGNNLQIWDAISGNLLATHEGHTDAIQQLAFSPDQHSIVSTGSDNMLYLWQIPQ